MVPEVEAKKCSLCEGLLWQDSAEAAWRLVPAALRWWGIQARPERRGDREGKGWRVRAAFVPTKQETASPATCGTTSSLCNGASLE